MNALGIPILNDRIYPQHLPQAADGEEDYGWPLQLLAQSLEFIDPISGHVAAIRESVAAGILVLESLSRDCRERFCPFRYSLY